MHKYRLKNQLLRLDIVIVLLSVLLWGEGLPSEGEPSRGPEGWWQEATQTKPIRHLENLTVCDEIDTSWLPCHFFFIKERILDPLCEYV